jgi:hypothetical protein
MKYFQAASIASAVRYRLTISTVVSVAPSTATHSTPRLFASSASSMVNMKA